MTTTIREYNEEFHNHRKPLGTTHTRTQSRIRSHLSLPQRYFNQAGELTLNAERD